LNLPAGAIAPKLKIILVAVAAAAALTVILLSASAPAGAYSGGTSTTTSGGGGGGDKYQRLWDNVSRSNKRWARHTAECESGKDPDAIGGGGRYRGAFQFMKSTWRQAPKSPGGDPIKYSYRTQAVVAVYLKKRDGTGHWPNCG
jgi:soluble lytic murein transglycosylase-like protein